MKKIVLFLVFAAGLPSFLSAQIMYEKSIAQKIISGELWDEIAESNFAKNTKNNLKSIDYVFSTAAARLEDKSNSRNRIYEVPVPTSGFFKFVYDTTEATLTKASKRSYYRESGILPAKRVSLPDVPKSLMYDYAYNHAVSARHRLLKSLQEDPFGSYDKVDDETTRRAYEYRQSILDCGGLDACVAEIDQKYGEKKVAEYKNILQVREDWLIYKDKNPVFKLYTLNGHFEDLQFLNRQDYDALVMFFSGKEPAGGWQYTEYSHPSGYFVTPSPINNNQSVIYGTEILVRISDNLEVKILPENLSIRVYKKKIYKLK